jgi:putative ABC transport system permease protein
MWTETRQDVWYALRSLRRTPGFTVVAILTLALGIGANTAIFSVINSVLLRPLPYASAHSLAFVWSARDGSTLDTLTPGRFVDLRTRMTSLASIAAICQFSMTLTGGGAPEQIPASSVSSSFFDVLQARPLLGEPFHAGRADPRAVVLSHGLWLRRFGGDPGIIGREITLNGASRHVAAVMREDFGWPAITTRPGTVGGPELWIPGAVHDIPRTPADNPAEDLSANRSLGILRAVARLREGVTLEQAQREADVIARQLETEHPDTDQGRGALVVPLRTQFFGPSTQPLLVLLGAVAFVLAIACANVASLLLGRASSRRRELAIRLALGATRARVIRQLLTEAIVLALGGAAAGLLLAWWAHRWLLRLNPGDVLRLSETRIDPVVLGFSLVIALATGLIFGIVPAWQASSRTPKSDLNDDGARGFSSGRGGRTRDMLVALEVAVALVLLVGAGLMLRSFSALARADTGIELENLLTFAVSAPGGRTTSAPHQVAFYEQLLARVRSLPGVTHAGAAVTLPIGGDDFSTRYVLEGQPLPAAGLEPSAGFQIVSAGYFETMGMRVVAGRAFREGDTIDAPQVVAVNETLARQAWPDGDAVGRRLRTGRGADAPWFTVTAVVSDIRHRGPAAPPRPELYHPLTQRSFGSMAFVVRTSGEPRALVPAVRAEVSALAADLPISQVGTMEEHVERALARPKFMSTLIAAFGALALALAVVGIYGVMSYAVSQRAQEIAIRMALGARRSDVIRMVLSRAALLATAGIVGGLGAAAALSRVIASLLFGVSTTDTVTFAGAAIGLLALALLAAGVPAVRASRISGADVLRS